MAKAKEPSASPKRPASQKDEAPSSPKKANAQNPVHGQDIRSFLGGNGASSKLKEKPKPQPISIDSSDDDVKPVAKASTSKKPIQLDESEEEDIKPISKPAAKTQAAPAPKAKPTPKAAPAPKTVSAPQQIPASKKPIKRKVADSSEDNDDDDDFKMEESKPKKATKRQSVGSGKATVTASAAASKRGKSKTDDDDEGYDEKKVSKKGGGRNFQDDDSESSEEEEVAKPIKKAPAPKAKPAKAAAKPKAAKAGDDDEKVAEPEKPKFNFAAAAARKAAGPANPGGKQIPDGAEDCLAGLTLVFTGELSTLAREEAVELAKRYGAAVTGAPSGKTSYVIVGENAGPSKLKKIASIGVKTLDEDGFLDLIRTRGSGELTEKQIKVKEKAEQEMKAEAEAMRRREKEDDALRKRKAAVMAKAGGAVKTAPLSTSQLWTTKYAPQNMKEICGNKGLVDKIGTWLEGWPKFYSDGFKKPGKDGFGIFRAILLSGPPGIGKTTSAHLMAKMKGYSPIEMNASDTRSKKLIENATNIDNASLDGWFGGGDMMGSAAAGIKINSRSCLIMDEVDGMSAGDRGGVGALNVLIRKTKIPIILICNDVTLPKMKPLHSTTYAMKFRRPSANEVRSRLMSIMFKEGMTVPPQALDQLVAASQSDIRQVLNMLSTWKLNKKDMNFDESKNLGELSAKYSVMTPFNIVPKVIGPYAFSTTNRETLNDKLDYYFQDFSFVPLFIQENYIKNSPARVRTADPKEAQMKTMDLFSKAADSISDGDLIDRMIHGQEQHWSLLPAHGIASTIRPAWHIYGSSMDAGYSPVSFPQWLGQNSKQQKLGRQLGDVQAKMRLRVTGGRDEIRQDYLPILAYKTIQPLAKKGASVDLVDDVISVLDQYYLNKEDWDALVEMGVGHMAGLDSKIPSALKSAFTRQYNKADHPIAFHRGEMFASSKKVIADKGPAPDNEDVLNDEEDEIADDPAEDAEAGEDEDGDEALKKDKLIKVAGGKKGKAAPKTTTASTTSSRKKK